MASRYMCGVDLGAPMLTVNGVVVGRIIEATFEQGKRPTYTIELTGANGMETFLGISGSWAARSLSGGMKWEFGGGSLSDITDKLNNLGDAHVQIPASLHKDIADGIAEEQNDQTYCKAVALVKDGLQELKRRKQIIADKARELKALKAELRIDKAAFIKAANQYGAGE